MGVFAIIFQACEKFINQNNVTQLAGGSCKSAELLARYCDLLLKKREKNLLEAELEHNLSQVVLLLEHVHSLVVLLLEHVLS